MAGHTPGPWYSSGGYIKYRDCENDCRGFVASIGAMPSPSESIANAELIAMAPTMLEYIRDQLCECHDEYGHELAKCDRCNILEVIDGPAMRSKSIGELIDEHKQSPAPRGE